MPDIVWTTSHKWATIFIIAPQTQTKLTLGIQDEYVLEIHCTRPWSQLILLYCALQIFVKRVVFMLEFS